MERMQLRKQMTMSRTSRLSVDVNSSRLKVPHNPNSKSATLSPSTTTLSLTENSQLSDKIEKILNYLKKSREEIVKKTSIITQNLNQLSKTALNELLEYEFRLLTIQNAANKEKPVKIEELVEIQDFFIPKQVMNLNLEPILKELRKIFVFNVADLGKPIAKKEYSDMICSRDYSEGLISINLNTYEVNSLKFAPKIYPYSMVCRVSDNKIFINGGYDGSNAVTDTFIVDIQNKSYESLPCSVQRDAGGVVLKDNKVYVFGGIERKGVDLDICESFDLTTYEWTRLTPLPKESHANTASLNNDRILVTGFHFGNLLEYQENGFKELITLPGNCMKFIFENWIITSDELLEYNKESSKWVRYFFPSPLKFGWLYTFSSTRLGKFIYFIDDLNGLLRIDTLEKKIDRIV